MTTVNEMLRLDSARDKIVQGIPKIAYIGFMLLSHKVSLMCNNFRAIMSALLSPMTLDPQHLMSMPVSYTGTY